MKYLMFFLFSFFMLMSCGKNTNIEQNNTDNLKEDSFDSPNLLELENNNSLPEKALGDD